MWPIFDGWCASRNVDHYALPWDRWLNLVYYFATRNASEEDRKKFDQAMNDHVAGEQMKKMKPVLDQARKAATGDPKPNERARRLPPKPAGWGTDTKATFDNKAAFTMLTSGGVNGKARR